MKNKIVAVVVLSSVLIMISCKSEKSSLGAYYSFETECIGTEYDGSLTLRAWGSGNTKNDAVEQAMKRAVHDVIFNGVLKGISGTDVRPLILEANAEEKYRNYFDEFFVDGGAYLSFVNFDDEKSSSKQLLENRQVYNYGVTVRVLRSALKKKLQEDGIIKKVD